MAPAVATQALRSLNSVALAARKAGSRPNTLSDLERVTTPPWASLFLSQHESVGPNQV